MDSNTIFDQWNYDTTPNLTLKGKCLKARVVNMYDGDTITCVLHLFGSFYKFSTRLSDIDTCEMKSKNEETKSLACKAHNRLIQLITKSKTQLSLDVSKKEVKKLFSDNTFCVTLLCDDFDKYGRLLAWVFPDSCDESSCDKANSFNHTLLREKLAYSYGGATKLTEEEQALLLAHT